MATCARCGTENPDRFRFCGGCGAPLAAAPAGRRERRVVSVLFADLVGFTSRAERLDVEDVEGFLGAYHRRLRSELERYGGTVEKFIGDAVMALFGAPVAHEDDPERAVRAALAILDAIAADRERGGADLQVRVGIATGEALVALDANPLGGEGMAAGDVVNTAARLQSAAPVDGILVDEATARAAEDAIVLEPADAVTVKGKAAPLAVWRALEARSHLPTQARSGDLPLVGRDAELGLLTAALARSRREPSAQLVTLIGAPGIGKTRVVEELSELVEEEPALIRWRRGRSLAYGEGVAFWALGDMVKQEAGILESDSAAVAAAKLDAAIAAVVEAADRPWVARHLRPLVGVEGPDAAAAGSRVEAFAAWRRFFEALAEEAPTVLVVEDLHWADDALLDFVDLLVDRAGAIPLLIVCTARPELLDRRPGWGGGKVNAITINLAPLSDEDTARLVGELLGAALLPADTQRALLERAEGNPLYAQEYVRALRDRGLLVQDGGTWRLTGPVEALPQSVQGIIAARLDTLSDGEKALIRDAAVVGKTAWLGAACEISGASRWEGEELLHALERKQLVRRARRSSVAGEVEFGFTHALTQEVAYSQIARLERAEKHERAAGWVERLSGEREDKAELLAHHYATALDLRRSAGEDTAELVPRARAALAEAGRYAQAVNAHAAAARHLGAALELTAPGDPERPRITLDDATARFRAGLAGQAVLEGALAAQVEAGEWEAAALASYMLGQWLDQQASQGAAAEDVYARGAEYAARVPGSPLASQIAYRQAYRLMVKGTFEESVRFTSEAIRRAEAAGDVSGRALLLMWHGLARANTGDVSGVDDVEETAQTLSHESHPMTAVAYHNAAEMHVALGDLPRAAAAREQAARWAERFADVNALGAVDCGRAEAAYNAGDWQRALDLCEGLTGDASHFTASYARWTRGRIALARGDVAVALADARAILDVAATSENNEDLFTGLPLAALAHLADGDRDAADAACRRLFAVWHEVGGAASSALGLAELVAVPGQETAIGGAGELLPPEGRWRAPLVAIGRGDLVEAAALFEAIGSAPLAAAAHLAAARRAAARGETAEASREAEGALAFYRAVGATRYAAQAEPLARISA